jgi:hypothetical protein
MDPSKQAVLLSVVRASVVALSVILLGVAFYGSAVVTPTMVASQFTFSGITAGIMYAALKFGSRRNGLAALLVWYVVMTGLIVHFNWWLLILNFGYVAGVACAVWVFSWTATRYNLQLPARIAIAGAIMSLANGVIIVFLALFSPHAVMARFESWLHVVYRNLQLGALIGLAAGTGIELSEYLVGRLLDTSEEDEPEVDSGEDSSEGKGG